jgi:hypothetical protein
MTEDNFEQFLKTKAQDYNAPPVRVPRDEMWAAIQAKRTAGPRVVYGGGSAEPVREKRFGTKVWLGAAAAAMLLVATGVGIGRWTAGPTKQVVAAGPLPVIVPAPDNNGGAPTVNGGGPNSSRAEPGSPGRMESRGSVVRGPAASNRVATNDAQSTGPSGGSASLSPVAPSAASQITVANHLGQAEALLTSFRTRSNPDQQMDAQLGAWARQLLTNTRLLLDSPIANDPQRRPLLEDLELVLVQIVQLSPGSMPQDREMIEKTLKQDNVITRLRIANPANAQRGS